VKKSRFVFAVAIAAVACAQVGAAEFASYFSDNMVLQRDVPCPVWGYGDPNEKVELAISSLITTNDGVSVYELPPYTATADADGRWRINLNPTAAGGPYTLTLRGDKGNSAIGNVMFGDVYLCSGQSNMEFRVAQAKGAQELIASAGDNHNLRLLQVENAWSGMPLEAINGKWAVANPTDAAGFSAIAFIAGKKLADELDIPIGLVQSDWGGTPIQSWISRDAMMAHPDLFGWENFLMTHYDKSTDAYKKALADLAATFRNYSDELAKAASDGSMPPRAPQVPEYIFRPNGMAQPAVHFNAMINPLIPAAFKGVFWYQGCANVNWPQAYGKYLDVWAEDWRTRFNSPELPLFIVQIAPYDYERFYNVNPVTEAFEKLLYDQQLFTERDPNAYIVIVNDVGDVDDIHPTEKIPVGNRIANLCLKYLYGCRDLVADSPSLGSVTPDGKGGITVRFANVGDGLVTSDGNAPDWFEVSSGNGIFFPAEAKITGADTVYVKNPLVTNPVSVRFAWSDKAEPNLRNSAGLPAGCFKSALPEAGDLLEFVPEAADFQTVFRYIPTNATEYSDRFDEKYEIDNSALFKDRKIKRIGYFVEGIRPDLSREYAFVTMDPFVDDAAKIGVPFHNIFQQKLTNIEVKSNVEGVANGKFAEGVIEFWPNNYDPARTLGIPSASDTLYDWDDRYQPEVPVGHGSMQIHNISAEVPQVVFAFNAFMRGKHCEFGIGTNKTGEGNPDYVYTRTGDKYKKITIVALAEFE